MPEAINRKPYQGELSLASPQILHPLKEGVRSHRVDSRYIRGLIKLGMYIDNPNSKKEITALITNIEDNQKRGRTREANIFWKTYIKKFDKGSLQIIDDLLQLSQARLEFQSGLGLDVDFLPQSSPASTIQKRVGDVLKKVDQKLEINAILFKSFPSNSRERLETLFKYLQEQDHYSDSPITQMIFLSLMEGESRHAVLDPIDRALQLRSESKTQFEDISENMEGKKDFFRRIVLSRDGKLGAEFLRGYHRLAEAHLWKLAIENYGQSFGEDYETAILAARGIAYKKSSGDKPEVTRKMIEALTNKNPEEARRIMIDDVLRNGEKSYDQRYWQSIGVTQEMRDWFRQAKHKDEVAQRVLDFEKSIDIQIILRALGINSLVRKAGDNLFNAQGEEIRLVDIKDGYVTFEKDEGLIDIKTRQRIPTTVRARYTYGQLLNIMSSQNYWRKEGEKEPSHSRVAAIMFRPKMDYKEIVR